MLYAVVDGMARTLFVTNWADRAEERGEMLPPGTELMDVAPETSDYAKEQALRLYGMIEGVNSHLPDPILRSLLHSLSREGRHRDLDLDNDEQGIQDLFGHYLAMEALGHGVSWSDDHPDHELRIPNFEYFEEV